MAKMYLHNQAPPPPADMARLAQLRGSYNWPDIIRWQDEVGLRRGVVYDDKDDAVIFQDFWPLEPHEAIIGEFIFMFLNQLRAPWAGTQFDPVFEGVGSASKASQDYLVSKANVPDYWYPGKKTSPDWSYGPNPRPNPNDVNAALVRIQPLLGKPWPTIVLEIGNSQSVPDIIRIREPSLGIQPR
jgi:hypothetical protein